MNGSDEAGAATRAPEDGLSEEAVELCVGWFAKGSKVTLTISPPHENLHANRDALDELVARGHILHEYDDARDAHVYRGTSATSDVRSSARGRTTAMKLLGI